MANPQEFNRSSFINSGINRNMFGFVFYRSMTVSWYWWRFVYFRRFFCLGQTVKSCLASGVVPTFHVCTCFAVRGGTKTGYAIKSYVLMPNSRRCIWRKAWKWNFFGKVFSQVRIAEVCQSCFCCSLQRDNWIPWWDVHLSTRHWQSYRITWWLGFNRWIVQSKIHTFMGFWATIVPPPNKERWNSVCIKFMASQWVLPYI